MNLQEAIAIIRQAAESINSRCRAAAERGDLAGRDWARRGARLEIDFSRDCEIPGLLSTHVDEDTRRGAYALGRINGIVKFINEDCESDPAEDGPTVLGEGDE